MPQAQKLSTETPAANDAENPSTAPVFSASPTVLGYGKLAVEGITALTDIVESMHSTISRPPWLFGKTGPTRGVTGFVYNTIRSVAGLIGSGFEELGTSLQASGTAPDASPAHEAVLAAINGVLGDYLAEQNNPLAIPMQFRFGGKALSMTHEGLSAALGAPNGRILVMAHGHSMNDLFWKRDGHDHGAELAAALGYTTIYLRYNSGRHISQNGREFAQKLEELLSAWPAPVEELTIVAHSLGGLVSRSACHYGQEAGHAWPAQLKKLVFIGTPHHGAPMERAGNWLTLGLGISPYTAPIGRLAKIRSACITDMRYGYLLDSDWEGRDRFAHVAEPDHAVVPLPATVRHYAIAASLGKQAGAVSENLWGDGMVPLDSALGRHAMPARTLEIPASRQWIGYGIGHVELLYDKEVYATLERFLSES